jgi:hypothetical protein
MSERDDLDLLLDAALRSYADPGADSGLEQRILRNVAGHAATTARHPWRSPLLWAAGLSLVAACLLLVFVSAPRPKAVQHTANTQAAVERRPQPDTAATSRRSQTAQLHRKRLAPHSIPQSTAAPKLAVFPTPMPLSAEERELVLLVGAASAEQRKDLVIAQQQGDAPLRIAAISIPSLEPPEKGKE